MLTGGKKMKDGTLKSFHRCGAVYWVHGFVCSPYIVTLDVDEACFSGLNFGEGVMSGRDAERA